MLIQTEVLDHSPPREKGQQTSTNQGQWEQPQAQMINQHQPTSQAMLSNVKYNNRREYKTDRNQTSGPYYDQYYLNPGQDYHNTGNRFDCYDWNRQWSNDGPQKWTSTVRDYRDNPTFGTRPDRRGNQRYGDPTTGDTSFNNSLLNLLDSQHKVQHDTTQALEKIISLQDTRANDMFLSNLLMYTGIPNNFLIGS